MPSSLGKASSRELMEQLMHLKRPPLQLCSKQSKLDKHMKAGGDLYAKKQEANA
jgi:hypothetical protein